MTTVRTVTVTFNEDDSYAKEYHYYTIDMTIKAGDYVIVDSPISGLTRVKVRRVSSARVGYNLASLKYIVGKVEPEDKRLAAQQRALTQLKTVHAQISSRRAVIWKKAKVKFIDELAADDVEYNKLTREANRLAKIAGIKQKYDDDGNLYGDQFC